MGRSRARHPHAGSRKLLPEAGRALATGVSNTLRIAREEIFGSVLSTIASDDVARELRACVVWIAPS